MGIKKEVIKLIDDMIKTGEGKSDIGDILFIERRAALTELKDKIDKLGKLTTTQVPKSMKKNQ